MISHSSRAEAPMRRLPLLALTMFALAFAPAPFPKQKPGRDGDRQRIQGSWVLTLEGANPTARDTRWVFGQGKMQIVNGGNRYNWEYSIDPTTTPRALDMNYRPNGGEGSLLKAIYSIENDTLTIAYGNWSVRPKSFNSTAESMLVMTFKRER
jgi:uncharacterized protein (TIGR03067 family)